MESLYNACACVCVCVCVLKIINALLKINTDE